MKRKLRQLFHQVYDLGFIAGKDDEYEYAFDPTTHRAVRKEATRVVNLTMKDVAKLIDGKAKPKGKGKKK